MKWARIGSAALLAFSLAACDSLSELTELEVVNDNNPDRSRALQSAGDVQSIMSSSFLIAYNAQYHYNPSMALSAAADEISMSWGNFGLQQLSSEPRVAWPNEPSWNYSGMTQRPWYNNYEALSAVYDAWRAIVADSAVICAEINCDRAFAFGRFVQGYALGFIALMYDSAFVFDETVDIQTATLGLQSYPTVMNAALGFLQDAIDRSTGAGWSLPTGWMNGYGHSASTLAEIAHGLRARFMAQVARTPTERAAADWAAIIAEVDAGITEDIFVDGDGRVNWENGLLRYGGQYRSWTWGRADYKTIGYTEDAFSTGTGYTDWLATPAIGRQEFVLAAPDLRVNSDTAGSSGTDFYHRGRSYFRANRGTYHFSRYTFSRWGDYIYGGYTGQTPFMRLPSQQLLKAEGLYHQGGAANLDEAATIVNVTRVGRGGLEAAAGGDADLFDKIRYEYQIENFIVCGGCAYFSRRGWDDFANGMTHHFGPLEGTQVHFAVPGVELQLLEKLMYTYGGVGQEGGALAPSGAPGFARESSTVPARLIYAFNGMDTIQDKLDYIYRNSGRHSSAEMLTRH